MCKYKFQLYGVSAPSTSRTGSLSEAPLIKALSAGVAEWLRNEGVIPPKNQALFSYAVYCFVFGMLPILLAFVLGLLFRMLQESLIMILPFMLIRKFSGGYHLNNPKKCILFSSLLLSFSLWCVKIFLATNTAILLTSLVALSTLSLWVLSPIDNNERKLSECERRAFRRISRILSVVFLTAFLSMQATTLKSYSVPIGIGIVLVAVLQLPCIPRKLTLEPKGGAS